MTAVNKRQEKKGKVKLASAYQAAAKESHGPETSVQRRHTNKAIRCPGDLVITSRLFSVPSDLSVSTESYIRPTSLTRSRFRRDSRCPAHHVCQSGDQDSPVSRSQWEAIELITNIFMADHCIEEP